MESRKSRTARAMANVYQNLQDLNRYEEIKLARQRREQELADLKRREEDESLNERLADTLDTPEYRPMPFGGEGYSEYNWLKQQEALVLQALLEEPIKEKTKPTKADPEIPESLKDPRNNDINIDFRDYLKIPSFVPGTKKVSVAEEDLSKDLKYIRDVDGKWNKTQDMSSVNLNTASLSAIDALLNAIKAGINAVEDLDTWAAELNVQDAINDKGDATHANFWGDLWNGFVTSLSTQTSSIPLLNRPKLARREGWSKNAVGSAGIKKNTTEISSDAGEINKYKELISRGADMQHYGLNILQIMDLTDKLNKIKQLPPSEKNNRLMIDVMNRINQLKQETVSIHKLAKDAASYYPSNNAPNVTMSGPGMMPIYQKPVGATTDLDTIESILKNGYENITPEQRLIIESRIKSIDSAVKKVLTDYQKELPHLLNRMADNIRELRSWESSSYKPSEEFTRKAEAVTEFNFTDPNTYIYGMPGLIGSSMSFGGYQVASTLLGLTAMGVGTVATGGVGAAALAGISAASTGMGVIGGHYENDAEVADNYQLVFIQKLTDNGLYDQWKKEGKKALDKSNATDEEIMWAMAAGIYQPKEKIKDIAEISTYGVNNLYKDDMTAVVGSEIFEAGLNFLGPIVKIAKSSMVTPGAKASRFKRMYNYLHLHPNAAKAMEIGRDVSNSFKSSEIGTAIASSVAFPLAVVGKAIEAGVRAAIPKSAVRLLSRKLGFAADLIEKAPVERMAGITIAKNLASYTSKVIGSGWSEAIEEGKQYLNGKKFAEGSYAGESDSLMDSIINDIAGGSRAAYSFIADMFGATADKELIANMKGGFLGGFGHTALISGVNAITETTQDLRASDFVANNVLALKLADRTTISNNAYLATQTSPRQYARVMNAFDAMEKIAQTAEERGNIENLNVTSEDVKNQRKEYLKVFDFANRENVLKAARSLNITPGSKEYGTFIGLAMWAKDLLKDALTSISELSKKEQQIISSWISGVQNDERSVSQIFDSMSYEDLKHLLKALDLPEVELEYETAKDGNQTISIPDTIGHMAKIQDYANRAIYMQKYLANLDALFTLRDQLELEVNPTTADKRRLRSVNRQIKRLKAAQQNEILKNVETAQDMLRLVVDTEVHGILRDLYRDSSNYTVDLEEGVAMEYMLLGQGISGAQFLTDLQMMLALIDVQGEISNRESGAKSLINKYNYSIKQDEELLLEIHDIFESLMIKDEQSSLENLDPTQTEEELQETAQETPVDPISEPSEPILEPLPTIVPEVEETQPEEPENESISEDDHDLDEQVNLIESEYAQSTNTMFTAGDVNTDFEISTEDWNKVSLSTKDMIDRLMLRYIRFVNKWNGKPVSRSQYNGIHGNVVKLLREFDELRERAYNEISEYDNQHNQPVTYKDIITDDSIWEQLHPEILIEQQLKGLFDEQVQIAQNIWDNFINKPFGKLENSDLQDIQLALSNAQHILVSAEEIGIYVSSEAFDRLKFDITLYQKALEKQLPPPPPNITPANQALQNAEWTHYTTTHTGSASSRGYNVEDSVAVDDKSIRFQDVSADPNFVQDAVIWFTLRPNGRTFKIQMNVLYKGHRFTPIDIHTGDNKEGKDFWVRTVKMIQNAKPELFVIPQKASIHRSNGIIDNGPMITMEQAGFITDDNLYSIAFTNTQDTFCIVKYEKGEYGRPVPIAYVPGQESGISKHEVYRYSSTRNDDTKPADGGLVMMVHPPYPTSENDSRVPVNIHYSPITPGDALLIVDLLSGEYMSDRTDYGSHAMENQEFTENGISKGLTRMLVLRLLIRYKSSQESLNPYEKTLRYVEYDPLDQRYVILHGNFGKGVVIPRNGRFDITDKNQKLELKEFLQAHHNRTFTYNEFLRCNVSENNNDFRHPLRGLVAFANSEEGKLMLRNGGLITFGNSSIVFDSKDLGDGQHPQGVSGLAWAMRRGFVLVKFQGFTNTLLNFDTQIPVVYNDQQPETVEKQEQPATQQVLEEVQIPEEETSSLENYYEGLFMHGDRSNVKFDEEQAKQFIKKVLGEDVEDDIISDRIQEIARSNRADILGFCHYSGRLLFDPYAPQGTMYHEVFHKLLELVVGNRTRMMLYKAYAKKMHIKYKDDQDLSKNSLVQEGLAEEFRYYMENRPAIKLSSLRHPFRVLKQFIKFFNEIGDYRLYTFYAMSRAGLTKKLFKKNAEKTSRFLQDIGAYAPFEVGGHQFLHILNRYQYRLLRNTLVMLVFDTNDVGIAGENIENLKVSKAAILRNKKYLHMIESGASGALALQELVENLEYVENDLKSYISQTMEVNKNRHDDEDNIEEIEGGENATGVAIGNHIRDSKEFSQFSRVSQKVKFLFARVPKIRYGYRNGEKKILSVLNDEGLLEYFDSKYVFNVLVNRCHDCRNSKELMNRLATLASDNAMIGYIYNKVILPLYNNALKGDADAEAVFAQMLVALHAAKGEYVIGKARRSTNGTWSVNIERTDSDYNAREYKKIWSNLFANGAEYLEKTSSGYQMKFRKGSDKRYSPKVFHNVYMFLNNVYLAVKDENGVVNIAFASDGKVQIVPRKVSNVSDFDHIKHEFCNTLQKLGILFNKDELDYMLQTMYGSSDYIAFNKLMERTDKYNITPFLDWINGCYNHVTDSLNITKTGTLNGKQIDQALSSFGFIGLLADQKYKYSHDHDQLSVLATKGNRYYVISENNLITDITDDINASIDGDNNALNELKSFSYNRTTRNGINIGSLVIDLIESRKQKISVCTVAGFRTDQKSDLGQDYAEISPMEDYITKLLILLDGNLIFPTMSDKKTWTFLKGLDMPWVNFVGTFINLGEGKYTLSQDRNVLQLLVEYAYCELETVQNTIKQVRGYKDNEGTKHPPLAESEKVLNFHKGQEYNGHTIVQGGRFGSLTGIYDEDGKWVSFNRIHEEGSNKYMDELANWRVAQEYFFGVPSGKQGLYFLKTKANDKSGSSAIIVNEQQLKEHLFKLLSRSLQKLTEKELEYAASIGLILRISMDKNLPIVLQYKNKLIDKQLVDSIASKFINVQDANQRESLAIATILNRASVSSIISLQEVERLYAGHPAFFKWNYNEKGDLVDRSIDQHKRLGGLISTGLNNVLDIPGIPEKYVCAEVDNEFVGSSISNSIKTMMEDSELRSAYIRMATDKIVNKDTLKETVANIEAMSIDEIKEKLQSERPDMYKILTKNAEKKANDFIGDIDVADGAAYVTDEMAEWMLRMVGSWDKKVERAFKILRGEEVDGKRYTVKDIRELSEVYKDVLTTVIGNQKYTAYGFRFTNGIAAAYYDKMALFPMFKSISTGPSAKIFLKMKDEGVHMLMINSSVKVGSLGSKPMNMSDFREDNDPSNEANFKGDIAGQDWKPSFENDFHFNTYEQKFKYIRKQFNTDPKEAAINKMGTQMTKVAMANLISGRDYLIVEGVDEQGNKTYRTASGESVRNDIMDCINQMSNIGERKVRERFIIEHTEKDAKGNEVTTTSVNIKELSKFLREELASRGASQESIEAVSLTLDQKNGEYTMYIPPVALNSLEWIQSIITSMINKNVIDINTPGGAFIQRSAWLMEGPTTVQDVEDLPESIYEGRELQMINEEGTMDCVLSLDFFEDIIPHDVVRDPDGNIVYKVDDNGKFITNDDGNRIPETQPKSFKDARQWLIDNNIISGRKSNGKWSNATANIVGSRIPTQAPSSIHALRCVDVLEVVRDTVVLPKEFTKITGADFDIDKLFLSRFYYKRQGKSVTSTFEEGSYEYYANRLLSNYIALLKDSKSQQEENINRTAHSNHASIDGDTKLLKDIIKDLEEGKEQDTLDPFTPYSLWANALTKTEFITGKFGIGPFALNNNSHILTMLYGVKFKNEGFMSMLDARRLDISIDRYGNSILSWLSGLINAHVDVAKDPYISRLNVNTYTYNLVNLMIRTGFGKDTFYFMTQPIMKDLAQAYQNASSLFGSETSGSKYRRQKEACEKVMFDFVKKNFKLPDGILDIDKAMKVLSGYFTKVKGISMDQAVKVLLSKDNDILHQISKKQIPANGRARLWEVSDGVKLSTAEVQLLVYYAKTLFEPYEKNLSDLVKYSKIDTKKQGKNVVEQTAYRDGVNDLFDIKNGKYGLFEDLKEYYTASYIQQKTDNALNLFEDILGEFTIESTRQFLQLIRKVMAAIGETNPSSDMYKAVSRQIMNYIRAGFFNKWAEDNGINIKGLVNGDNTISDRLEDIRIKIMTDPTYSDMLSSDGSIKNYLLKSLVQGFEYHYANRVTIFNVGTQPDTHPNAKFVKTLNFMDADHVNEDDMTEAWDELLNDDSHKDIKDFARDLIMYAYITSGGNSGSNLFKFIPNSWKLNSYGDNNVETSYAQYMLKQLDIYKDTNILEELPLDTEEIILNNWFDNKFIPVVSDEGFSKYYTKNPLFVNNQPAGIAVPVIVVKQVADIDRFTDEKYIKIRRDCADQYSQRNYTIYKKVAYTADDLLIYAMVDPKGNQFPQGNTIYEMRRSDTNRKESAVLSATSAEFTQSIGVAKSMYPEGYNLASILEGLITKIRDIEVLPTKEKMVDLFTLDPKLNEWIRSAVFLDSSEDRGSMFIRANKYYSRYEAEQNKDVLYIFTDNTDRDSGSGIIDPNSKYAKKYGQGHHFPTKTSAVIRGLDNAMPISTQRYYHPGAIGELGRWTDDAFDEFKSIVDDEIKEIKKEWATGKYKYVVYPQLFNTKISNISEERTPKIHLYLTQAIIDLELFINTGTDSSKKEAEENGSRTYKPGELNNSTTDLSESENRSTINIYAGTGENVELSNFAHRPFDFLGYHFNNVEQAFLYAKLQGLKELLLFDATIPNKKAAEKVSVLMLQIMDSDTGKEARRIGKTKISSRSGNTSDVINWYFLSIWEKRSLTAMKMLIKASFEQNLEALKKLLETGDAILTHTQDGSKWGTEFPRILMKIREELKTNNDAYNNMSIEDKLSQLGKDLRENQCK